MKHTHIFLVMAIFAFSLLSCSKEKEKQVGDTKEAYIDATSKTTWHYYSFSQNKIIGSADESEENNAIWAARKDWDIAIQRYTIRTNSGEFTKANAKGGVYTFSGSTKFSSVLDVPEGAQFVGDKAVTSTGMGGVTTTVVCSQATVILFKTDEEGNMIMPPVYLQAPVYIFRTADGNNYYKVQFTQYVDEDAVAGHVKFNMAQLYE